MLADFATFRIIPQIRNLISSLHGVPQAAPIVAGDSAGRIT